CVSCGVDRLESADSPPPGEPSVIASLPRVERARIGGFRRSCSTNPWGLRVSNPESGTSARTYEITLGSKYAGRRFAIREEADGTAILTPVLVVRESERALIPGAFRREFRHVAGT